MENQDDQLLGKWCVWNLLKLATQEHPVLIKRPQSNVDAETQTLADCTNLAATFSTLPVS